ncbi:hypothetical protein SAMN06273572_101713 [Monaibacterium marinum]|uniref:Uncharacterized protein n=1 Tax=Pontivivens marinum TaxID=1690039 RepID=A0A2C9CNN9_9RHOB|nr:hypothetical protein [Monaibacterium marinum]SOH92863.1 hypothetical protein SAMN06273572_101713 [Monaibacterium marinum]
MAEYPVGEVLILNNAAAVISARCVSLVKSNHGYYDGFGKGDFSTGVPVAQVLSLNLGMMTGMGGPADGQEFYVQVWPHGVGHNDWVTYTAQTFTRSGDAHVWFKATGTIWDLELDIYPSPSAEELQLARTGFA